MIHMKDRLKVGEGQDAYPALGGRQKHLVTTPAKGHLVRADRLMVGRNDGRLRVQDMEQIAIL